MIALSRFILWIFFSVALTSFLFAEETPNTKVAPPMSEANPYSSSNVSAPSPSQSTQSHNNLDKIKDGTVPQAATTVEATPSPSPTSSLEPSPQPSTETSSSITPTDPSMVPSPEGSSTSSNNDPSIPAASSSNEPEQASSPLPELPSTESIEKKKQELKVRYYEVRTEVEKEPEVSALKEKADHATTDEGKRQALRSYYELLFTKMKKKDPSITERCDLLQKAYLRRLEQVTLQPTIPLSLSPTGSH